jgi:hypothetical protein
MYDSHQVDEVAIWCRIARTSYAYQDKLLDGDRLSDDHEEKIAAALIAGEEDVHSLDVAAEAVARLLACYEGIQVE